MAELGQTQDKSPSVSTDYLETAGKALALVAAFLPAVGILTRYVAFAWDQNIQAPAELAIAASPLGLAMTGAFSFFALTPFITLLLLYYAMGPFLHEVARLQASTKSLRERAESLRAAADEPEAQTRELDNLNKVLREHEVQLEGIGGKFPLRQFRMLEGLLAKLGVRKPSRIIKGSLLGLAGLPVAIGIVFAPGWPVLVLDLVGVGFCAFIFSRAARITGRLRLRDVWMPLVLLLLIAAVSGGLRGEVSDRTRGDYYFRHDPSLNGEYARLGDTGTMMYLVRCVSGPTRLIVVRSDAVDMILLPGRQERRHRPSLWGIVFREEVVRFGYRPCG